MALAATAATLIVVNGHPAALPVLPVAFALLASHTYTLYGSLHDKAVYRAALENQINRVIGAPTLVWESVVLRSELDSDSAVRNWLRANPLPGLLQQGLYFAIYLLLDVVVLVSGYSHSDEASGHLVLASWISVTSTFMFVVVLFCADLTRKTRLVSVTESAFASPPL